MGKTAEDYAERSRKRALPTSTLLQDQLEFLMAEHDLMPGEFDDVRLCMITVEAAARAEGERAGMEQAASIAHRISATGGSAGEVWRQLQSCVDALPKAKEVDRG